MKEPLYRKSVTQKITNNCVEYWKKKKYSIYTEIGMLRYGILKADLVVMNLRADIFVIEIKSCYNDWKNNKHVEYLMFCDRMFYCIDSNYWTEDQYLELLDFCKYNGIGVINTDVTKLKCKVIYRSSLHILDLEEKLQILARLAWRNGDIKRNMVKRRRTKSYNYNYKIKTRYRRSRTKRKK